MSDREAQQKKADNDNKSNQCNPNNERYEGHQPGYQGTGDKADLDNHSQQLNPNNEKFQEKKMMLPTRKVD